MRLTLRPLLQRTRSPRRAFDNNTPHKGEVIVPCVTAALVSVSDAQASNLLSSGSSLHGSDSGVLIGAGIEAFKLRSANLGVPR
jgi:hypothetical protein